MQPSPNTSRATLVSQNTATMPLSTICVRQSLSQSTWRTEFKKVFQYSATQRNSMESNSHFCKRMSLQKITTTMREFHHGSGLGQPLTSYQSTKLTKKDYAMHYLTSTTKIYAVLKHSISLMQNAYVNFARVLATIIMKDIVRRWSSVAKIHYYY